MTIKLSESLKNIKGEALKDSVTGENVRVGEALSNILLNGKEGGKMKLFILAKKCFEEDSIDLDASDSALIKNVVKNTELYNALIGGQIELILEEKKD